MFDTDSFCDGFKISGFTHPYFSDLERRQSDVDRDTPTDGIPT